MSDVEDAEQQQRLSWSGLVQILERVIEDQKHRIEDLEAKLNAAQSDCECHNKNLGKTEVMADVMEKMWQLLLKDKDSTKLPRF